MAKHLTFSIFFCILYYIILLNVMTYTPITPKEILDYLLHLSQDLKTELTIEKVREILNLEPTTGIGSFELIVPELKFKKYYYKDKAYVKITPDYTKLKMGIERRNDEKQA